MKCEHCGKNEVSFVYRSNINGQVEEKHLCSECAAKLGYTKKLAAQRNSMLDRFFNNDPFDSLMEGFFSPMPSLLSRSSWLDPFDDFFAEMPALGTAPEEKKAEQPKQEDLVDEKEQSRFSYLRQLNALKLEMKKAVHKEEFERAAELRDEIRKLEAEHNENK